MTVLERVQLNPEIGTDDSSYVTELVARAREFVRSYCNIPVFPELSQGYSKSATSAGTDISGITSGTFWLNLNGSADVAITPDLTVCTSGVATAAELQSKIRAVVNDYWGFDEVTVTYASTQYTITSGRYGESSTVHIWFDETAKHLAQALKLTTFYGGTEYPGMALDEGIVSATVEVVEQLYRRLGVEGMESFGLHQGEFNATAYKILSPTTLSMLKARRRLWA